MQRLPVEQSAQDKTIRQGAMLGRIILDHFAVFQRLFHVTAIPVFVCQFSNGMARPENLASFRVTLILPGLLTDKILFSARHNSNHSMWGVSPFSSFLPWSAKPCSAGSSLGAPRPARIAQANTRYT